MSKSYDETNSPRDQPRKEKRFYAIEPQDDGTVDVYLSPVVCVYNTALGVREFDVRVRVVRGVVPWPELENDIRQRYVSWCESGEEIDL